ncbi:MAG: SufE family protein [Pseudomonadota bacterium]|nr:SufE family protein [Pseudomonadota bacterium]
MKKKEQAIINEFRAIPDWEATYRRIIEEGKSLSDLPLELKIDKYKVKGCQSQVWLIAERQRDGLIYFTGDSDAILVKGLLSLLLKVFSGETPRSILEGKAEFIKELKLDSHLTPSRSNGLYAMLKQIKYYAQAFLLLETK